MAKRPNFVRVWFVIIIGIESITAPPFAEGQGPATEQSPTAAHNHPIAKPHADFGEMLRYESTGISVLRPYARGKVPVVFIHGLWSNPWSWSQMIKSLDNDSALRDRYQFWTFGYSTGDPLPYSALLRRSNLEEVHRKFDPNGSDSAFDQMVVIGHSMGGLLTKMMVQDTGTRLWQIISDRPVNELAGDAEDRDLFRRVLIYKPRPEVRRVVFIATPHRGSQIDQGPLGHLGSRLIRLPDPLRASYSRLIARNRADFFNERLRKGLPTSVDELEWQSPILVRLDQLGFAPGIKAHSIIAVHHDPPRASGGDGVVPYDSAHLDGVVSELLVSLGHLCQDNAAVIREVRRILLDHMAH